MNRAVTFTIAAALTTLTCAFKAEDFRYCQDSSFCRRHRKFDGQNAQATYYLHGAHQLEDGSVSGDIFKLLSRVFGHLGLPVFFQRSQES